MYHPHYQDHAFFYFISKTDDQKPSQNSLNISHNITNQNREKVKFYTYTNVNESKSSPIMEKKTWQPEAPIYMAEASISNLKCSHLLWHNNSWEEAYLDKNCQSKLQRQGTNNHHSQIISWDIWLHIECNKASWCWASSDYDDPTKKLSRDHQEKLELFDTMYKGFYNVSRGTINDAKDATNI